jgi:tetratricopeptide (TPR) repeat protein
MKKKGNYILAIICMVIISGSCEKGITPSLTRRIKEYDSVAFDRLYVEGIKLKLMGNSGEALKFFEQCIKLNTESDATYYQMAQILIATGDIESGKKNLKKAYEIDDKNLWYIMMLASTYYKEEKLDSAIIYYENAIKYYPEKTEMKMTLGNLYSENKKFDKANRIFKSIDEEYGINKSSTVASVQNLMWAERYNEALDKIKQLLEIYPEEILYNGLLAEIYRGLGENNKAMEVYNNMIENYPEDPQTQLSLCDFLINQKRYNELFIIINKVIMNDNIRREDKLTLFARMIETPTIVETNGNKLQVSLMVLEEEYKNDHVVQILRPEVLIKQNRYDEAENLLEEIIKKQHENYFAFEKLLLLYLDTGNFNKLEERGKECATKFNRSFLAKVLYATGAMENKNYETANEELRKATILAGNNQEMIMQVLSMKADNYYRMKEYEKAFETFEEALKTNKDDMMTLNNYAYYLAEQDKRLKEAEEMARKVIEKEEYNNTYLDTYGWVLYKRGKLRGAEEIFRKIIESGGNDPEYYEHYGYILKKRKKCEDAIIYWEKALKLDKTKIKLTEEIKNCRKQR